MIGGTTGTTCAALQRRAATSRVLRRTARLVQPQAIGSHLQRTDRSIEPDQPGEPSVAHQAAEQLALATTKIGNDLRAGRGKPLGDRSEPQVVQPDRHLQLLFPSGLLRCLRFDGCFFLRRQPRQSELRQMTPGLQIASVDRLSPARRRPWRPASRPHLRRSSSASRHPARGSTPILDTAGGASWTTLQSRRQAGARPTAVLQGSRGDIGDERTTATTFAVVMKVFDGRVREYQANG